MWRGVVLSVAAVVSAAASPTYVGAKACARCHQAEYDRWSHSRHSKMLQPASQASVKGDFSRGTVVLRGLPYQLSERDGVFYITESYLTGKPQVHRVDYTLGNRRVQHYLTTLASGRIIVLPPSWDVLRKQWFHNFDIGDPDETGEVMVQVWNKNCFSCHVSQEEKNFDAERNTYQTAWLNFGTNCERCHGPGSEHVAHYSAAARPGPVKDIVLQTRLEPERNSQVCAQCHSFRDIYVAGYKAGDDYYDYFLPILEANQPVDKDPAYWPDGRTRRFSNDAFGLWQSECYLKGRAVCVNCHVNAHETEIERNPQLRPDANALCGQCHDAIVKEAAKHSHHAETSAGNSCVECHMPRTVLSIKAEIRDHSMSVPVPENTLRHGIPNACNNCHRDRDPEWAAARMDERWGKRGRARWIRRADAFSLAAAGKIEAVPLLLAILDEPGEGPLARANAASYLARFSGGDSRVFPALRDALTDREPLVRAIAALRIGSAAAKPELVRALGDPVATVRIGAVVSLVAMGVKDLPGEDGTHFLAAKKLFEDRARLDIDDASQQIGAGRFYFLTGDMAKAIAAFEASLRIDPEAPAGYLLGAAYAENGRWAESRKVLEAIPAADPQYARAQRLLAALTRLGH